MAEFKLGRMTLKSLFSKPATKLYPIEAPQYYDQTKGRVSIEIDKCHFCGACQTFCPTSAIQVDRKGLTWAIDRFKCIQCRTCMDVCEEKGLEMLNHYTDPATEHVVEVYEVSPEERVRREKAAAEKAARIAKAREEAAKKKAAAAAAAATATPAAEAEGSAEPTPAAPAKAPATPAQDKAPATE